MSGYQGDDVLDLMNRFAVNRNNFVEKLIIKFLQLDKSKLKVLEFGAGKGEFIYRLTKKRNLNLLAVENDPEYCENLSKNVKAYRTIEEVPGEVDCIYLIDVLEHLKDDDHFLQSFQKKLKENGRLFVYVPARKELLSDFDRLIGHFRRYSKNDLAKKIMDAGFVIEEIRYHELLGYFAMLLNKWFGRGQKPKAGHIKFYDKVLVPLTNAFEKFFRIPIGKSLYVSAIKR
jgi:cyclopropane fatty-acyl-phospholipid synthase-like methyltransferase